MTPYYSESGITIYHGDCLEVLPSLTADVLVTDPPYGVGLGSTTGSGDGHGLRRLAYADYDDSTEHFVEVVVPAIEAALAMTKRGAVFTTSVGMRSLPMAAAVGGVYTPSGSGRHAWGFRTYHPILYYGSGPRVHLGSAPDTYRSTATCERSAHPCPKPIEWMRWLVQFASLPGETILDPFMGTGTTLRAAKDCGRPAIGIEITEMYCEIAAKRLSQGVLFGAEVA